MPGLVIGGKEVEIPGVKIRNFKDDPKLALRVGRPEGNNDGKTRTAPVTLVVLHTTKGIPGGKDKRPQVIKPGMGPDTNAGERTAQFWALDPTPSGTHLVVDHNGDVFCLADLMTVCAYHAGQSDVNNRSVGIEIYQGSQADLYEGQLHVVLLVVNCITEFFGIQRQIPDFYRNRPVPRLDAGGGRDLVGVVGHRDVSDARGQGDPGDAIMQVLADGGYERFDFFAEADKVTWKLRQKEISDKLHRQLSIDGIPMGEVKTALKDLGYLGGLWANAPTGEADNQVATILTGLFPGILAAAGGDKEKALSAISSWVAKQK